MNANVNPQTIFTGDNLPIMRGMNSESVDLIYLDPPFNSNANYAAPIGSEAAGADGTFEARNRGLFLLGVSTGGRISELLSFRLGDVYQNGKLVSDLLYDRSIVKGE